MSDTAALPLQRVPEPPLGGRLLGDERLARLAGRGSERAFAALYERHHQAIYRYCRSILHNEHDAQEAMQSAMMRAYTALRARERERELAVKPWLFRIAHNESVSMLRRRRPEQELSEEHQHPGSDVEHTLERHERLATLVADLQALPERQRAALVMRELSGLSMQEIADALHMSPGTAKQTLFEARDSLHELAQGRAMQCESVRQAISLCDGRVLRGRRIRAHLHACSDCRDFREAIGARRADLAAIAPPLPASLAATLLARLLAHSNGHAGGSAAASAGAGPGALATGSGTATSAGSSAATGTTASAGAQAGGASAPLGAHAVSASPIGKGVAAVAVLAAATAGGVQLAASHHRRVGAPARVLRTTATPNRAGGPAGSALPARTPGTLPFAEHPQAGGALRQRGVHGGRFTAGAALGSQPGEHRSGGSASTRSSGGPAHGSTGPADNHPHQPGAAPYAGRSHAKTVAEAHARTPAASPTHRRSSGGSPGRRQSNGAQSSHRGRSPHSQRSHAHSMGQPTRREHSPPRSSSPSAHSEGASSSHKQAHEPSHGEAKGAAESSTGASEPGKAGQQH